MPCVGPWHSLNNSNRLGSNCERILMLTPHSPCTFRSPEHIGPESTWRTWMNMQRIGRCVERLIWPIAITTGFFSITTHAAETKLEASELRGPYVGLGLGVSKLGSNGEHQEGPHKAPPAVAKWYGGYQLSESWGVEAGVVQLDRVHRSLTASDGVTVHHTGDARSLYMAGTGRVPLGSGFSLTGKLGVSFGHVSGMASAEPSLTLGGSKVSTLLGVGAQYQVNRNIALTMDLDGYGKVSEKVKASAATLGIRYSF